MESEKPIIETINFFFYPIKVRKQEKNTYERNAYIILLLMSRKEGENQVGMKYHWQHNLFFTDSLPIKL